MKKSLLLVLLCLLSVSMIFGAGAKEVKKTVEITEPVTIEFWHAMGGTRIDLIQGIVDDFMKENPNITVKVQYTGSYGDTLNKVKAAAKAGNAPAVFHSFDVGTLQLAHSGIITPIGDIEQWDPINWDDFFAPVRSYYTISGKHYSMPFNSSTPLLYYNKTFFEKAGLDPEKPPVTFDEVVAVSKKLKAALPELKAPITWNLHSWYFEQFNCLADSPLVNENNGREGKLPTKAIFNSPAAQQILEWWTGMEKDGLFLDVGPGWANHRAAFGAGEVAMVMSSSSDVNQLTGLLKEKGWEMGTGYIPRPAGAKGGVAIGGGSLWISNGHSDEELLAALKLVKYISSDGPQMAWHKGTGYFPVRKTAMEKLQAEGWFDKNPNFLVAFNQLLDSPTTDNTAGALMGTFPEVRDLIQTGIQKVYAGDMTVKEMLDDAAAKATASFTEWNELVE
ncbi:MAG: ABC transporter substrate-binding protein [Spirochaetaceae bacterium]|nr:ABC transporter substrate-binding protein [Spirochaetaceae bacterium]